MPTQFPTTFTITNIHYDTDGHKVKLPKKLKITIPADVEKNYDDVENYISDEISNRTGFCPVWQTNFQVGMYVRSLR